ncbi:MAG: cysteine peptidase family C39 domain-containing protein, partial [Flammeovirgaceae bacterium]
MISVVKQTDVTDCGVACAESVLSHFNINQNLASIKRLHPFKIGYYSFNDLSQIFDKYNLEAIGYFSDFESLMNIKNQIIAHIKLMGFLPHFVVMETLNNDEVTYMDPN